MTEYLTVKDYAKSRQLSPWTVYRLVGKEEIEFERFGRAIRIAVKSSAETNLGPKWKGW